MRIEIYAGILVGHIYIAGFIISVYAPPGEGDLDFVIY